MKKAIWIPVSIGLFLIVLLSIVALTDTFEPIIAFIHNQKITWLQIGYCIVGAVFGFYIVYKVLVLLGEYFLPKD